MSPQDAAAANKNAQRKLATEDQARLFYATYAAGVAGFNHVAWEGLSEPSRVAWRSVVEFANDNQECVSCGSSLYCLTCEADSVGEEVATALKRPVV